MALGWNMSKWTCSQRTPHSTLLQIPWPRPSPSGALLFRTLLSPTTTTTHQGRPPHSQSAVCDAFKPRTQAQTRHNPPIWRHYWSSSFVSMSRLRKGKGSTRPDNPALQRNATQAIAHRFEVWHGQLQLHLQLPFLLAHRGWPRAHEMNAAAAAAASCLSLWMARPTRAHEE